MTFARALVVGLVCAATVSPVAAQMPPSCKFQQSQAMFFPTSPNSIAPAPDPFLQCQYHEHLLTTPANSANLSAQVTMAPGFPVVSYGQSVKLVSSPLGLTFLGSGGPATLRLEYRTADIPPTFAAADMRAYIECTDNPGQQPPLWCMPPDPDPVLDVTGKTVSTQVTGLPTWSAALPKLSTLTAPADASFTNTTPITVSGAARDYILRLGAPQGSFTNYRAQLRVKGATLDTLHPALNVNPTTGLWSMTSVALEENENTLTGWIYDPPNDRSFDRVRVVLDTTLPVLTLTGIAPGSFTNAPPVVIAVHEVERWPDTHVLAGTRSLAAFLGAPAESVALSYGDPELTKTNDTTESRDFASPDLVADGDYALTFTATDRATNAASTGIGFTIDTVAPLASLSGVAAGSFQRLTALPSATISDRNLLSATVSATLDGVPAAGFVCADVDADARVLHCTARAAQEGVYVVTATGGDRAGNAASPATLSFTVDRTRPAISLSGVDDGESKADPFTVQASVSDVNRDPATETYRLERDGELVSETTTPDPSFSIDTEGDYTLTVSATDKAGNARLRTFAFSLDATAPVIAIEEPVDGVWTAAGEVPVVGTTDEKRLASVTVEPGAHAAAFTGSSWLLGSLALVDGANTITATARDRAGRTASASIVVHRDNTAPVVTLGSLPSLTRTRELAVTGDAADAHLDEVDFAGRRLADLDGEAASYAVDLMQRLVEGENTLTLEATDLAGNRASTSRVVTLDTRCDTLRIVAPGVGHRTRAESISVSGVAEDLHGIEVTVAGQPATLAADGSFAVSVALVEGGNTIAVDGEDGAGNLCHATVEVVRDRTAPTLSSGVPGSGASGVDLATPLVLTFSEPIALHGGLEVEVGGSAVAGSTTVVGAQVVFQPTGGWPSLATVDVTVTVAVSDLLGNALATPSSWSFATVDHTAPDRVVFSPPPPAATAAASLTLCGTAEAESTVRIEGNTAAVEGPADATGHFCLDLALEPNALNQLIASARDGLGNRGPGTVAYVRQETVQPIVVESSVVPGPADKVVIEFSKEMDCATVSEVSVLIETGTELVERVVTCGASTAEVTSSEILLSADPFVLTVTTAATDTLGNALAFRYAKVFHGGTTLVTGEVYDAATGLRLPGATASVFSVAGNPPAAPVPTTTTNGDGELTLAVEETGATWLVAHKEGYAECYRELVTTAGLTTPVFDFRLSPLNPVALTVPAAGGSLVGVGAADGGPVLVTFPAGLPAGSEVRVSALPEQGLASRLPIGWTPVYGVDVRPHDLALPSPVTLRVPNRTELTVSDDVQLARFDASEGVWEVGLPPTVSGDGLTLVASLERLGSFAFVVPDEAPESPPVAVIGGALGEVLNPPAPPDLDPTLELAPGTIFPSGQADARVSLRPLSPMTSGVPLQVDIRESLELVDTTWVEIPVFVADVVGYARGALFPVKPSITRAYALFREGRVELRVYEFPENLPSGNVVGTAQQSYTQGAVTLHVESDAVDGPTPLIMTERDTTSGFDLAGFSAIRAIDVSFGGASLRTGARLALAAEVGELAGTTQVVLLRQAQVLEQLRWVFVSLCDVSGDVVTSRNGVDEPGVRKGGLYVLADLGATPYVPLGGSVREATGDLVDEAMIDGWGAGGVVGVSFDGGKVATLASVTAGVANVVAESAFTRDRASVTLGGLNPPDPATTDITLAATGPFVLAMDPANGATNVPVSRSIVLTFSEPVQLPTLQSPGAFVVRADGVVVEGTLAGVLGGLQAIFHPTRDLPSNAHIEVAVGASILDFAGHGCAPATLGFHTIDTVAPASPGRMGVTVLAPDGDGLICVSAPAAADVLAVTATNLATGFSKGLTRSTTTGLYEGCLWGEYGHVIRLSWLDDAGNAATEDFNLFLEADTDAPTVVVGPAGGSFTADDDDGTLLVSIPAGAFDEPVRLSVDPKPGTALAAMDIPGFELGQVFEVRMQSLTGDAAKVASADLDLALDPGSLVIDPAEDVVFLVRAIEVRGELHPELVAQMEVGADGLLRTRHPAVAVDTDPTELQWKGGGPESLGGGEANAGRDEAAAIAGLRRQGDHAILVGRRLLTEIAYYMAHAGFGVIGLAVGPASFPAFAYEAFPEWPLVLPVLAEQSFEVEYFDPKTGRSAFRRRMPPIPVGRGATDIEVPGDGLAIHVSAFTPGRLLRFDVSRVAAVLAPGISAVAVDVADANGDGIPDDASFELEIRVAAGTLAPRTWVRAVDVVTGNFAEDETDLDGKVTLVVGEVAVGHAVLLSVETAGNDRGTPIVLRTSAGVDRQRLRDAITLRREDQPASEPPMFLVVGGGPREFTVTPTPQLEDGKTYHLTIAAFGSMTADFEARFTTREIDTTRQVATYAADDANDLAKLGGILFLAAGGDGLRIVDVSAPPAMTTLAIQPTAGAARGVSLFEHRTGDPDPTRYAVVVGGGSESPGFISVIDVSRERILETAPAEPLLVRTEIASNRVGLHHEEDIPGYPAGRPLRVRALEARSGTEERDLGFVAVIGDGLQVWDLTRMVTTATPVTSPSRLATYPADGARDVALWPREARTGSGPDGEPITTDQVVAVLAERSGVQLIDATDPSHLTRLSYLPLAGPCHAVSLYPGVETTIANGRVLVRDLAFVAAQAAGVHVVDISDPATPRLVVTFEVGAPVFEVVIDVASQRAIATLGAAGLVVLDISGSLHLPADASSRILARIEDRGLLNTGLLPDFDLGTVYASAESEGVVAFRFQGPKPRLVSDWDPVRGEYREWPDIVPLGVNPPPGLSHTAVASVAITLPGGIGETVYADLEPLDGYGQLLRDPRLTGIAGAWRELALRRRSDDKLDPGYNVFVSEELTFTADPRLHGPDGRTVMAGDELQARLLPRETEATLAWLTPSELDDAATRVRSWPLDRVPASEPAPVVGASTGTGDVLSVFLHSGEFAWSETDLSVPGRLVDFAWSRSHLSQSPGNGPLGRAWDSPYLARVRVWPDGSIVHWDGSGGRVVYPRREEATASGREFDTPSPRTTVVARGGNGVVLAGPSGSAAEFNVQGDLAKLSDRHGNAVTFLRDASGRLETIVDTMGRMYTVTWDAEGRITRVADPTGRDIVYTYDADDHLLSATLGGAFTKSYTYDSSGAAKHAVKTLVNEKGETWLVNHYRADGRVERQTWGGHELTIHYNNSGEVEVTDRRGYERLYRHNPAGQLLELEEKDVPGVPITKWEYDGLGRLARLIQPLGNKVEWTYEIVGTDPDPRRRLNATTLTRIPDAARGGEEEVVERRYDGNNQLSYVKDERGNEWTLQYDTEGNLRFIDGPRGSRTRIAYSKGQPIEEKVRIDEVGEELVTRYAYWPETAPGGAVRTVPDTGLDPSTGGYLRSVIRDEPGRKLTTTFDYDALGRVTRTVDPAGAIHDANGFDAHGLPATTVRDVTGFAYATSHTYDPRGLPFETTSGGVITREVFDLLGRRSSLTVEGPGLESPLTATWTYDANGNPWVETTPAGVTITTAYDARNQPTRVTRAAGALEVATSASYDLNGNVSESGPAAPAFESTAYTYDGHDRPIEVEPPLAATLYRTYHPGGLVHTERHDRRPTLEDPTVTMATTTLAYDALGFPTSVTRGPSPAAVVLTAPDLLGRVVTTIDPRLEDWTAEYYPTGEVKKTTDPLGNTVECTYHPLGGVATETRTDAGGGGSITLTTRYDALGRAVEHEDAGGHVTRATFDARDNLETATDAEGRTTTYTYDALDRVRAVSGPLGETVITTYDAHGNVLTYTDARGNVTSYGYDDLGRKTSATFPGLAPSTWTYVEGMDLVLTESTPRGFTSTFGYDGAGQRITREVREGTTLVATETFAYDELGRAVTLGNDVATIHRELDSAGGVLSEEVTVDGIERELSRTFDAAGAVSSLTYPGGRALTYEVDDLGRLDKLKRDTATLLDYDWLGAERVASKTAGPLTSTYGYDPERLPASIVRAAGADTLQSHALTWTGRHEIERETDVLRRAASSRFGYDAAGRLATAAFAVPAGEPVTAARRAVDYGHDAVRNLTSRVETVGGPYRRELAATAVAAGNRYAMFDGRTLQHDADGNLTDDGQGRTFQYDWAGRLVSVTRGSDVVTYGYDVLGRKVKRTEGGTTRLFWYDDWTLIEETDALGAVARELVNGQSVDEPLFFTADGDERHLVQDRMGSVTGVVDADGELLEAYEYGPYGTFRRHGPASLEQARLEGDSLVLRFTGEMGEAALASITLSPPVTGAWSFSTDGRELRFLPVDVAPEDGEPDWPAQSVTVSVPQSTRTAFGVELEASFAQAFDASDLTDRVLDDLRAPQVERIGQDTDGTLRVGFSEAMSPADLAEAFLLRESVSPAAIPFTVTLQGHEVRLTPGEDLTHGEGYRLDLVAGKAKDLAEQSAPADSWSWTRTDQPVRIWDTETDAVAASLFGNTNFFQGRELDPQTGLYDFRNRWYDPELGRFLSRDPLGYPDGPNQYAAFLGNPVSFMDPFGLATLWEGIADGNLTLTEIAEAELSEEEVNAILASQAKIHPAASDDPNRLARNEKRARWVLLFRHPAWRGWVSASYQFVRAANPMHYAAESGYAIGAGEEPVMGVPIDRGRKLVEVGAYFALLKGTNVLLSSLRSQALGQASATDGTMVFRGDRSSQSPDVVFKNGIAPKGTNTNLLDHASTNAAGSNYVATSRSLMIGEGFAGRNGYVYVIRTARGINVNETLGRRSPFPEQLEMAVPEGVLPGEVVGAFVVKGGTITGEFIPNPAFAP